jgi:hypothetical protein
MVAMQVRCERLSELVMVRVAHDSSGQSPAWFLEEIRAKLKVAYRVHHTAPQHWTSNLVVPVA